MYQLVHKGRNTSPNSTVKCQHCKNIIEFSLECDSLVYSRKGIDGKIYNYGYISCPECNYDVIVVDEDGKNYSRKIKRGV